LVLINQNFRYMRNFLKLYRAVPVDGILADLGISSWQIDNPDRGFTTRANTQLDLRMNREQQLRATDVVNGYTEEELRRLFFEFGEIKNAGKLAGLIVNARKTKVIQQTGEFKEIIRSCVPKGRENRYHAMVFQALRIEVNREMEALREMLLQIPDVLKTGGRVVIISYHSLEDRLVKNFLRSGNLEGKVEQDFFGNTLSGFKPISRKAIVPDAEELKANPRSRSAKLRIAEKI